MLDERGDTRRSGTSLNVIGWTSIQMRLLTAGTVGSIAFAVCHPLVTDLRVAVAYDLAIAAYLAMLAVKMSFADSETTR